MEKNITSVQLKKLLKSESILIGVDTTLKGLKLGKVKKVLMASNCTEKTQKMLKHYAAVGNAEFIRLDYTNDEMGLICKKPFSISVLGVKV